MHPSPSPSPSPQPLPTPSSSPTFQPPSPLPVPLPFTSPYFHDHNQQQSLLQRAFQANNFTYLRNLPDTLTRNCILDIRKQRVVQQINDESTRRRMTPQEMEEMRQGRIEQKKKIKVGNLGYFQMFPYKESDYELPRKIAVEERKEKEKKRKEINELQFRPAGGEKKLKYEDPFRFIDRLDPLSGKGNQYLFPFHLPQDAYDSHKQHQQRQKILSNQLRLAGDFLPAQNTHSLSLTSKGQLPQILNQIQYYFQVYLKNKYGYLIGVNKRDLIEILFEGKYMGDGKLNMVMSGMLEHEILCRFGLRRCWGRWGVADGTGGYVEYVVVPAWVRDADGRDGKEGKESKIKQY